MSSRVSSFCCATSAGASSRKRSPVNSPAAPPRQPTNTRSVETKQPCRAARESRRHVRFMTSSIVIGCPPDVSRRGGHGDRVEASAGPRRSPRARRLRTVPGTERASRTRNWAALPIDPRRIDAVVLTHAHLDHCGYLPRLVAGGFRGRIFCTPGTRDLCTLVLPDSAHIQEEDARNANRRGYSKHSPALPLYTELDAARALTQLQPVGYDRPVPVVPGVEVEFINAGHLLGSAYARIPNRRQDDPVRRRSRPVRPAGAAGSDAGRSEADILLVESTYGDRLHEPDDGGTRLAAIVNETVHRGGKLIIPSFAIGRVEEVLYWLKLLEQAKRIPGSARVCRQSDGGWCAAVLHAAVQRARSRHEVRRA